MRHARPHRTHWLGPLALAALIALPNMSPAQDLRGAMEQDGLDGRMTVVMPGSDADPDRLVQEVLRFSPWELGPELARHDLVLLMRHGPTDWSKRDAVGVAPDDCENQRIMTEAGRRQMYELGALLVANDLRPGQIVVSRWCRNQQTLESMQAGMVDADAASLDGIPVQTMDELNLLLSLGGAPDVAAMRDYILGWEGGEDGPLLIVSHFTNIQELTERAVYEGEILVLDPAQEGRVLGRLLLGSAAPDVGHFE